MNGTECRPQAPVAEGGTRVTATRPRLCSYFLPPPTPSDNRRGALKSSASPTEVRWGEPTGLVPWGPGE